MRKRRVLADSSSSHSNPAVTENQSIENTPPHHRYNKVLGVDRGSMDATAPEQKLKSRTGQGGTDTAGGGECPWPSKMRDQHMMI